MKTAATYASFGWYYDDVPINYSSDQFLFRMIWTYFQAYSKFLQHPNWKEWFHRPSSSGKKRALLFHDTLNWIVIFPWVPHDILMSVHRLSMMRLWYSNEFRMIFPCMRSPWIPMISPDISVIFPWVSHCNCWVVWNMTFTFPFSWEFHHPNWLSYYSEG